MPSRFKSDFLQVRLTEAGRAHVGPDGQVHVANAHMAYTFTGDHQQRVVVYQWKETLSRELVAGQPMFEIVELPDEAAAKEEETH